MKRFTTIATVILIAILVMCIGGLAGWYVVLRMKGQTINFSDAMRGFGIGTPSAGENGSNAGNIGIGGGGGGGFTVGGTGSGGIGGTNAAGESGTGSDGGFGNSDSGSGTSTNSTGKSGTSSLPTIVYRTPRLWHVTKTPVAGFAFATSAPSAFFAERSTGYMFRADPVSGEILRRTNTLLPKTYEAFVARNGAALYRNVNETTGAVQTFSGIMGSSSSSNLGSFVGVNLRNNILALDANADAKTIFFVIAGDDGKFLGITEPWIYGKSGKEKTIFTSTIASWRPYVLSDGRFLIAVKPQDGVPGYAYEIKNDGSLKPLVRAAPGLTFLPLSGNNTYIFGTSLSGVLSLYAQTSTTTLQLPIRTVADKCVWAPYKAASSRSRASDLIVYCAVPETIASSNFLQDWYMGALHTSDSWWKINITTGESSQIKVDGGGSQIDVVDPQIDPTGTLLGFKNGVDGSLWILRISR